MTDVSVQISGHESETLDEHFPRFLIHPFEVIKPNDPRYDNAYTHEDIMAMTNELAQK